MIRLGLVLALIRVAMLVLLIRAFSIWRFNSAKRWTGFSASSVIEYASWGVG